MARGQHKEEGNNYFLRHYSEYLCDEDNQKVLSDSTGLNSDALEALMWNGDGKGVEEFEEFCNQFAGFLRDIGVDVKSVDRNSTLHYLTVMRRHTRQ